MIAIMLDNLGHFNIKTNRKVDIWKPAPRSLGKIMEQTELF